jgi:hypothetical protein
MPSNRPLRKSNYSWGLNFSWKPFLGPLLALPTTCCGFASFSFAHCGKKYYRNLNPKLTYASLRSDRLGFCRLSGLFRSVNTMKSLSFDFKPMKGFVSGLKENRDGKGAQQQELNNMNPSKSSQTVSGRRGGHSNQADEICPFWPPLRVPLEYSAVFARNYFQMAKFYAADHCTSYAVRPVKWFMWGFKGNQDGKSAGEEELNNVTPSKSSHSVIVLCGDHSNDQNGIRPFWPILRGPPEYSAVIARTYFQSTLVNILVHLLILA